MMNINTANHKFLKSLIQPDFICVDATAGNGNDTLFMCRNSKFVYAFDIQKQAEDKTRKRVEKEHCSNYRFILDDHALMSSYVSEADLIVFNLGFLPNSESEIITTTENTIRALDSALDILNTNGYLSIACYLKHPGGYKEYEAVREWMKTSDLKLIYEYTNTERELSPVLFILKKGE